MSILFLNKSSYKVDFFDDINWSLSYIFILII